MRTHHTILICLMQAQRLCQICCLSHLGGFIGRSLMALTNQHHVGCIFPAGACLTAGAPAQAPRAALRAPQSPPRHQTQQAKPKRALCAGHSTLLLAGAGRSTAAGRQTAATAPLARAPAPQTGQVPAASAAAGTAWESPEPLTGWAGGWTGSRGRSNGCSAPAGMTAHTQYCVAL
jgi:hypothetical protein